MKKSFQQKEEYICNREVKVKHRACEIKWLSKKVLEAKKRHCFFLSILCNSTHLFYAPNEKKGATFKTYFSRLLSIT